MCGRPLGRMAPGIPDKQLTDKKTMNPIRGILTQLVILPLTVILIVPMMLVATVKLLIPVRRFRRLCTRVVLGIGQIWAWVVVRVFRVLHATRYVIEGDRDAVDRQHSYMVICNHQTWVDIPVLLEVFDRRLPFYRFFLKRELMWLPLLGLAFWALEYPFMKRYSKAYLDKHPEKRGEDIKATQRACERMRGVPATIVNFPEGTRFTPAKQAAQPSPFRNLLRPRAGGVSFVMSAMGDQLDALLDVTIHYPNGRPGFIRFLCNGVPEVRVHVKKRVIEPRWMQGDYQNDPDYRTEFQQWINGLWGEKDRRLEAMK